MKYIKYKMILLPEVYKMILLPLQITHFKIKKCGYKILINHGHI